MKKLMVDVGQVWLNPFNGRELTVVKVSLDGVVRFYWISKSGRRVYASHSVELFDSVFRNLSDRIS